MASARPRDSEPNGELLHRFREYVMNVLIELFRNFEEGKSLDYISYCFEHTLLTVMQMEFVSDRSNEFISNLRQLLFEAHEILENLLCKCKETGKPGRPSFDQGAFHVNDTPRVIQGICLVRQKSL